MLFKFLIIIAICAFERKIENAEKYKKAIKVTILPKDNDGSSSYYIGIFPFSPLCLCVYTLCVISYILLCNLLSPLIIYFECFSSLNIL
jgi:hypothetical protein